MSAGNAAHRPCAVPALRVSYVGELGWEIYAPAEFGGLWDTLWDAGRAAGRRGLRRRAYDSLRLEKGYRLWGQDIDEEHNPYEAGLGWAVRLGKNADFIGRDAAAAAAERGVRGGCAAWSPTTPPSCSSARSRCSTATPRSAT